MTPTLPTIYHPGDLCLSREETLKQVSPWVARETSSASVLVQADLDVDLGRIGLEHAMAPVSPEGSDMQGLFLIILSQLLTGH